MLYVTTVETETCKQVILLRDSRHDTLLNTSELERFDGLGGIQWRCFCTILDIWRSRTWTGRGEIILEMDGFENKAVSFQTEANAILPYLMCHTNWDTIWRQRTVPSETLISDGAWLRWFEIFFFHVSKQPIRVTVDHCGLTRLNSIFLLKTRNKTKLKRY